MLSINNLFLVFPYIKFNDRKNLALHFPIFNKLFNIYSHPEIIYLNENLSTIKKIIMIRHFPNIKFKLQIHEDELPFLHKFNQIHTLNLTFTGLEKSHLTDQFYHQHKINTIILSGGSMLTKTQIQSSIQNIIKLPPSRGGLTSLVLWGREYGRKRFFILKTCRIFIKNLKNLVKNKKKQITKLMSFRNDSRHFLKNKI